MNITLLPNCPPGLTLNHDETTCSCYPVLANSGFSCLVKNKTGRVNVRVLESSTLLNLIVLSSGTLYRWDSTESRSKLLMVSIGIAFAQFCIIVVWSLIKPFLSAGLRCTRNQGDGDDDDYAHERIEDPELEPLIKFTPRPITISDSAKDTKLSKQIPK